MVVHPINWLKLAFLGLIWGGAFLAASVALKGVGPLTVVAVRLSLGASFLLGLAYLRGTGLPSLRGPNAGRIWGAALAIALFSNALPFTLLTWSQTHVASGFAGVFTATVPLFILPLAHLLVPGETMHLRRLIGFGIGTLGVAVLIGPDAFRSTGSDMESLARLACVTAACCYGIGAIVTRLCPPADMIGLAAAALTLAAVLFVPYAIFMEDLPDSIPLPSLVALLYLGLLPTGLAQLLAVQVIRDAGPVFMSLVNYQVPLWSVGLGVVILGEDLPDGMALALPLILGGVALSQLGALKRLFLKG